MDQNIIVLLNLHFDQAISYDYDKLAQQGKKKKNSRQIEQKKEINSHNLYTIVCTVICLV